MLLLIKIVMRSKCFKNFSVVVVLTVKKKNDDITCVRCARLQLKISFISFERQVFSWICNFKLLTNSCFSNTLLMNFIFFLLLF